MKMTIETQNRAKQEYSQRLSPVVDFLETLFTPDEELNPYQDIFAAAYRRLQTLPLSG